MRDEDLYRDDRDWESELNDIVDLTDRVELWKKSSAYWKYRAQRWRNIAESHNNSSVSAKWKALAKQYRSKYKVASSMLGMIMRGHNELKR